MANSYKRIFILGAPKCGTTSLANYLSAHDAIALSNPKEPHFFNDDFNNRHITDYNSYEECFSARDSTKYLLDASVLYLYSLNAVKNILQLYPDSKFIVCLRNPAEMAISWYHEAKVSSSFGETAKTFKEAWELQFEREQGKHIPYICKEPKVLIYKDICALGTQLERLYEQVSTKNVHLVFLDDLSQNPSSELEKIFKFLELPNVSIELKVYNERKILKNQKLYNNWLHIRHFIKNKLPFTKALNFGIANRIKRYKTENLKAEDANLKLLKNYFIPEIDKIGSITKKDLTNWKS